jgi:hypothetical protein
MNEVIGTPLLWNLFGNSCGSGDYQSFAAAARAKIDTNSASGFSGTFRRLVQIGSVAREGLSEMLQSQDVQHVSSAARSGCVTCCILCIFGTHCSFTAFMQHIYCARTSFDVFL